MVEQRLEAGWSLHQRDFVTAFVVNARGEALVLESQHPETGGPNWQMIGARVGEADNPITAVQDALSQYIGQYQADWLYLGTYEAERGGLGHLFFARDVKLLSANNHHLASSYGIRWVTLRDLHHALLDGRIINIHNAANVALALYFFPQEFV